MILLEDDEKKLIEVRRHWILFATQVFALFLLALAPLVLAFIVSQINTIDLALTSIQIHLSLVAYIIWLIIIWNLLFINWTHYYLDVWIVTDKRIIDFEFKNFFRYETTSVRLDRIQDMSVEVSGIIANIFHYGNLHVETAGEHSDTFIIRGAASPNDIKQQILKLSNTLLDRQNPPASGV